LEEAGRPAIVDVNVAVDFVLADADEAAVGTDPNNPDSDGDGYYDGDEVILGADPHDPLSFPTSY
jgi:hypothetical protein